MTSINAAQPVPARIAQPFTVSQDVPAKRIRDILSTAFDGGSTYWAQLRKHSPWPLCAAPDGADTWYASDLPVEHDGWVIFTADADGELYQHDDGRTTFRLDRAAIRQGIELFAKREEGHLLFEDEDTGDVADGDAADVFLQLCLFGEVVFG